MKIALIAPIEETVPPTKYGGTERVVANLAQNLVAFGHDVTLFASGGSITAAKLSATVDKPIRNLLEHDPRGWFDKQIHSLHQVISLLRTERFDVIHNHIDAPLLMFQDLLKSPIISTLHNPVDYAEGSAYENQSFVSISKAQRKYAPKLNYVATIHNGIDVDYFDFNDKPKNYFAFLGRLSPDKGPLEAIEVARRTNSKLIMAAKIDPPDRTFFNKIIKPQIDNKKIFFIGEIYHDEKVELLKNAQALISPIQWDEPFGLVNVEAMACGTPVLSTGLGAAPEIIVDGKVGFICKDLDQMVERVSQVHKIKRSDCRARVEKYFNSKLMSQRYVEAYKKVITDSVKPKR